MLCSTGSVYGYPGRRPLTEADGPGVPLRANYSFSKIAAESVCSWISEQFEIPLTIIRICSTYGPQGGAPADRFEMMLAGKPIRLHPDAPNNYNPIYEDDYVELGIRALEVAASPPIVVNWAGSETVSVEDYCTYMGQLVGIEPTFDYTPQAHTPLWPDVTYMHQLLGRTKVSWRDGFRRMIQARHPELELAAIDYRATGSALMLLPGTPSDQVADVLATGNGDITTVFVSMATRHPDGTDAEYLQWHTLDHRPEQHRLSAVRASLRLVSTPACRAARAVRNERFDPIDHVMTYFFSDTAGTGRLSHPVLGAGQCRTQTLRSCRPSNVASMRCRAESRRHASKPVPRCCRGGRPAACTCYWKRGRHPRPNWLRSKASRESGRRPRST